MFWLTLIGVGYGLVKLGGLIVLADVLVLVVKGLTLAAVLLLGVAVWFATSSSFH